MNLKVSKSILDLEKEIEELEKPKEEELETEEEVKEELLEDKATPPQEELSDEEKTWAKRYGDLRRLQQKTAADLAEANKKLSEKKPAVTEEEVKNWIKNNPKAADIIGYVATQNSGKTELAEIRSELEQEKALKLVLKAHPDFEEITSKDDFHKWADKQPDFVQDRIFGSKAEDVIWGINQYKMTITPDNSKKAAASLVHTKKTSEPETKKGTLFSESQVEKMSLSEYEKNEEAILKSQRDGTFIYDLTGGAR